MVTRKSSGKSKVYLRGGPFNGHYFVLSSPELSTFRFSVNGYVGHYVRGVWKGIQQHHPDPNPNIILSDN